MRSGFTALPDDGEARACLRERIASTDDVQANLNYIDAACLALDEVVGG